MGLPENCDFEPETCPEAFLQQEMIRRLREMSEDTIGEDVANELERVRAENSKLRSLIELIFSSTHPYNGDENTFTDKVTDAWKELTPNVELTGDPQLHRGASSEQSERG